MWSLFLVFGVAILIWIVGVILTIHEAGMISVLIFFAAACSYIGVAAPIAGMICGNNTSPYKLLNNSLSVNSVV